MRFATPALAAALLVLFAPPADAQRIFRTTLSGTNEVPPNGSTATGRAAASLGDLTLTLTGSFTGLTGDYAASHIHEAPAGVNGPVLFGLSPQLDADQRGGRWPAAGNTFALTPEQAAAVEAGNFYVNVHSSTFGGGEVRGQLAQTIALSEIRSAQDGDDNDEYFELSGPALASLDDLTYVVLGDSPAGGVGVIEEALPLNGLGIPADGFFVAAEASFTFGATDATVVLDFENDDSVTHLLVRGFTGAVGDDLDADDNGTIDITVWTEIVDAIGLADNDPGDRVYGASLGFEDVGPDGSSPPSHVYRARDTGAWVVGEEVVGANDTPGVPNALAPVANEPGAGAPAALTLEAAAPTPAMDHAMARFTLPAAASVRLALYDALGREVAVLAEGPRAAGTHTAALDATRLAPGVYVLHLEAGGQAVTQTLPVVR